MSVSGSRLASAFYGDPVTGVRPAGNVPGSEIAPASAPFVGRGNKCTANDNTCQGNKVKGEDLCAGHLRSARKAQKQQELSEEG